MAITINEVANIASGVVMAGLGAFVLTVKPRRPGNLTFALFAVFWGVGVAAGNWRVLQREFAFINVLVPGVATAIAFVGLCAMMFAFPARVNHAGRLWVWVALALTWISTAIVFLVVMLDAGRGSLGAFFAEVPRPLVAAYGAAVAGVAFAVAAYLVVISRLVRGRAKDDPLRRQYVVVSVALLLYAGYVAGGGLHRVTPVFPVTSWILATSGILLLGMVCLAALWLRESATGVDPRTSRNIALLALALPLLGLILSATGGAFAVRGVLRTLCVVVLAYAMLRHQLLGIDLKVRWTISKSTVAGIFIVVFFIASEGAQILFGQRNEIVGLAAAGGLVFVLAPLQRAADRLAAKAVPLPLTPVTTLDNDAAALYKGQAEIAWRDGRVSAKERAMLRRLRQETGLDAATADAIEEAFETLTKRKAR